jgi:hypothetical protein
MEGLFDHHHNLAPAEPVLVLAMTRNIKLCNHWMHFYQYDKADVGWRAYLLSPRH